MISIPDFTLMDSMAALQIMDPRMDSGIFPIPDHLIADCDRLPLDSAGKLFFDPHAELSAEEICWIMDRLSAAEIGWHKGASLSQTIYTCRYMHCLALLNANACEAAGQEPNWFVIRILQPFLITIFKSVGLVWDEVAKGNVADGEDFNCDKAGVSLLEQTSPDEAIDWLQDSIFYIQALQADDILNDDQAEALLVRMRFRKVSLQREASLTISSPIGFSQNLLSAISTFSRVDPSLKLGRGLDPIQALSELTLVLQQAQSQLDQLDYSLQQEGRQNMCLKGPTFSDAPSTRAMMAFDPEYCRRPLYHEEVNAPSAAPPPLPLTLKEPEETIAFYTQILKGLHDAQQLVCSNAGWAHWHAFLERNAVNFQRETTLAYVRSLWQSVICTQGIIGLQYTLNWIADSFLEQEAGISHDALSRIALEDEVRKTIAGNISQTSLANRIKWFMERLAGQLVNHLSSFAQNRSRGRRSLAATYPTLLELSAEAAAIDASLTELSGGETLEGKQLASAVQIFTLGTMQHIVYSGFEMDLYRVEECAIVYWIGHRIAEEKALLLESMLVQKRSVHLQSHLNLTKAILAASKAMELLYDTQPMVRQTKPPWQPTSEDEEVLSTEVPKVDSVNDADYKALQDIDRVAFCKRFKWLRGKGRPDGLQTLDNLWHDFQAERRTLQLLSVSLESVLDSFTVVDLILTYSGETD
jgi:hypothetical protein